MSSAVARPWLTMKLPWMGDTRAPPIVVPLSPAESTSAAADGAGRACPRLQAGAAMINRPPHQAVDADRGVGADVTVVNLTNLAGPRPNDQATHTRIRNEHVRSAAEDRDRHLRAMSQRQ